MHRAWKIYELRQSILEHLAQQDLSRLARTNRQFFGAVIDQLWSKVSTMSAFMCCLPKDYKTRKLQREDLARLDFYARKVHSIVLEPQSGQPVYLPGKRSGPGSKHYTELQESWYNLWAEIAALRPTTDFLPNLRGLRVNEIVEDTLLPLIGISGSQLRYVRIMRIQHRTGRSSVRRFFEQIKDTSNLEYLCVRDGEHDVPEAVIRNSPLKQVRFDLRGESSMSDCPLRTDFLEKASLESLTVSLNRGSYGPHGPQHYTGGNSYLPTLKALWLNLIPLSDPDSQIWTVRRFFAGLANPKLKLLNIRFRYETTDRAYLETLKIASAQVVLQDLTELVLTSGGFRYHCWECGQLPPPAISPYGLRQGLVSLLPLTRLKVLRLAVAPNFLSLLDLELYKSITDGLPEVEKICFGSASFVQTNPGYGGLVFYERVTLANLAAFCSMLPRVVDVEVGCADGLTLEECPNLEWMCPRVRSLKIGFWADRPRGPPEKLSWNRLALSLQTYFPASDMARMEFDPRRFHQFELAEDL